jgi:hypothetical protein
MQQGTSGSVHAIRRQIWKCGQRDLALGFPTYLWCSAPKNREYGALGGGYCGKLVDLSIYLPVQARWARSPNRLIHGLPLACLGTPQFLLTMIKRHMSFTTASPGQYPPSSLRAFIS